MVFSYCGKGLLGMKNDGKNSREISRWKALDIQHMRSLCIKVPSARSLTCKGDPQPSPRLLQKWLIS